MTATLQWLTPDWPAPSNVRALCTLRSGGQSAAPFDTLNLATHVGDDPANVQRNRESLRRSVCLPAQPTWLNQVHGVTVVNAATTEVTPTADGCVAHTPGRVCAILTADCLPVLFCDLAGRCVAAAHAGWRGLAQGILQQTLSELRRPPQQVLAWLGPAIGPASFEVGEEVREQFLARDPGAAAAFVANHRERWQADLYTLARRDLARAGVTHIYGGGFDCCTDAARFFSYRRDGRTGRMASLIWLEQ